MRKDYGPYAESPKEKPEGPGSWAGQVNEQARPLRTWSYSASQALRYQSKGHVERSEIPHQGIGKRDRESGLDYRLARFYDSDVGRFLNVDPLAGDFPASSMYEYALGNPVFYTDPDGQAANQYTFNVETGEFKQINDIGGDEDHTIFTIYGSDDEGYFDYSDPINFSGTPPAFAYSFSGGALFTSIPLRELLIKGGSNTMGQLYNSKILNRNEAMAMMDARVRSSGEAFIREPMGAVFMGVVYEALLMGFTHGLTGTRSFSNYGLDFAAKSNTTLVKSGSQFSKHATQRMAKRGVTPKMAQTAISKGQQFYDPLNKSINHILPNGFGSGKSLLVGTNPLTGEITTVLRSSKNLIKPRMIPIK